MNYAKLGRTALKVSRLCLGTMNFRWLTNETDSFAIMDRALDLGINFWDTADIYGKGKARSLSVSGLGREAAVAIESCWRRSSLSKWTSGRTTAGSPP